MGVGSQSSAVALATDADCQVAVDGRTHQAEALTGKAMGGDVDAFDQLVRLHQRSALRLANRLVWSPQVAEELVQEAFLSAFTHRSEFRAGSSFRPWFTTILSRLCFKAMRSAWRSTGRGETRDTGVRDLGARLEPVDPSVGPDEVASRREAGRRLETEIQRLPPRYRAAFVLRHVEDFSVGDVARALDAPEGTIKTLLFRAREMLRRALSDGEAAR